MGKAIPGNLLKMWELLSDDIQNALIIAVERNRTISHPGTTGQACPHCGESNTIDCSLIDMINDATVGLCLICGYLWCLECDSSLITGINCGHWQICTSCSEEKEASGYCGTPPWECPYIREWLRKNHPVV
ncbi:MAG: hypothetical protein ACYDHW_12230 [Syntrophorhabdaceae bacterium]